MDELKIKFSDAFMPGLIISLVMIVISLVLQYTVSDLAVQQKLGYVTWIVVFGLLLYYGIQYRNAQGNNGLPYGKSFTFLFYILLITSVVTMVFTYINFTIIDPDMMEQIKANAEDAISSNPDIPEEQIEKAIEMQAKFMTAGWMTFWAGLFSIIFSVVVALVGAIFIKRDPIVVVEE